MHQYSLFFFSVTIAVTPLALAMCVGGCSSTSSAAPTNGGIVGTDGVNDVSKACVIRTGWMASSTTACSRCTGLSTSSRCPCASYDFEGACATQESAVAKEPGCVNAHSCEASCKQGDCACADACYAGKDACRPKAAALDGCLAEVCDSYCK